MLCQTPDLIFQSSEFHRLGKACIGSALRRSPHVLVRWESGQNQDPGRVFPGKRMAGHLGNARSTVQNVEIIRIDAERQLLLIRGALPGSRGGGVTVRPTSRAARGASAKGGK